MAGVAERIAAIAPDTNKGWGVTIEPLRDAIVGPELRTTSLVLAGVVGVRPADGVRERRQPAAGARPRPDARDRGARRARRQPRPHRPAAADRERCCSPPIGGAVGLALAWAAVRIAPSLMPRGTLPQAIVLAFDARVALFAALLTLAPASSSASRRHGRRRTSRWRKR